MIKFIVRDNYKTLIHNKVRKEFFFTDFVILKKS